MKISFTTMATPGYPLSRTLEMAAQYGYDGVDIRSSAHLGEITTGAGDNEIRGLRSAFADRGIALSSVLCYNDNVTVGGVYSWSAMREGILRNMELANRLGSGFIRIFGPGTDELGAADDDCVKQTAEVLANVFDTDRSDVRVLIQHHRGNLNAAQCLSLADMVNNPRFGLVFSPDHCVLQNESPDDMYAGMKKHAGQLYVADLKLSAGKYEPVLPGQGILPLDRIYEAIGGDGFDGYITFKWEKLWHPELDDPETALPYFTGFIRNLRRHV